MQQHGRHKPIEEWTDDEMIARAEELDEARINEDGAAPETVQASAGGRAAAYTTPVYSSDQQCRT